MRGHGDERLAFDVQPAIAEKLGYAERADISATERFLKHYFLTATDVGRLTRIVCAKLEAAQAKGLPQIPKVMPRYMLEDEAPGKPLLKLNNGRLDLRVSRKGTPKPVEFFRLFRAFSKSGSIDVHPQALSYIASHLPVITSDVRKDLAIAELFMAMLMRSKRPVRALRLMAEVGLLGKYIPSFGEIMGRTDYGLYRQYTLDEHVLQCIDFLHQLKDDKWAGQHPISTRTLKATQDYRPYFLAVLLHETLWTVKDKNVVATQRKVERICKRLGLEKDQGAQAAWASANYELMVSVGERRNLADPRTIAAFVEEVETQTRLDLLLIMTVCHFRMVGKMSWDDLMNRRLTALYHATTAWIKGGEEAFWTLQENNVRETRKVISEKLQSWPKVEVGEFLQQFSQADLSSLAPETVTRFATLMKASVDAGVSEAVSVTTKAGDLDVIVYADDRPGLLSDLAGAAASCGLSVRFVQAFTTDSQKAFDYFVMQLPEGDYTEDPTLAGRLHEMMLKAAKRSSKKPMTISKRIGDLRPIFTVTPSVRVDAHAAADNSVLFDVEGLDRPGLLYDLTRAFSDHDLVIVAAHIVSYGERAVDAFYVRALDDTKAPSKKRLAQVEKQLMSVLAQADNQ